ncbi:hypothetical protein [Cryobacterium sp. CG_9.6]|uniref:hypothetical protein n=1 Tax=Cryobacterium sp. CG_9.6 TaxID=2760710 RepID=UPI002475202F|nr:hypothetical protein [Cryobacterium sp. CG_9.6]MDH6238449.1 hypothetical protein [Cryobacterium sp. CG_9.6]
MNREAYLIAQTALFEAFIEEFSLNWDANTWPPEMTIEFGMRCTLLHTQFS